jgi:hypothetical protein
MTSGGLSSRSFHQQSPAVASGGPTAVDRHARGHHYFVWWQSDSALDRIHDTLHVECREKAEREASPTACIIDSQSVKSAEKGGPALIRMAVMRGKRSRARSVIFS